MNTHKNARLTYLRRLEMVQDITLRGMCAADAAAAAGVSVVTARKWLGRYLIDGAEGLLDRSSKPAKSPRAIDPAVALAIVELRRKLFLQAHIRLVHGRLEGDREPRAATCRPVQVERSAAPGSGPALR